MEARRRPRRQRTPRPEFLFAHRLWYRCRVNVPASLTGRSFVLTFPQNSLNTTVVVNGVPCGFNKHPFVPLRYRRLEGDQAGEVNGDPGGHSRDYAGTPIRPGPSDPMKDCGEVQPPAGLRPNGISGPGLSRMGVAAVGRLLVTPAHRCRPGVHVPMCSWKPSDREEILGVEVTVANSRHDKDVAGEVVCEAVDPKTGAVAKAALPAKERSPRPPGKSRTRSRWPVSGPPPHLWWPDEPYLYDLRTTVKLDGRPVDVRSTRFGFRSWGTEGKHFTLNGVRWRGWNVAT